MASNNIVLKTVERVRSLRRNVIIAALFMLVQGIFFIAKPNTDPSHSAKFVAALIVIVGAVSVISYFLSKEKTLSETILMVLSCVLVIAGIVLFIRSDVMAKILRYAIGIIVAAGGVASIIEAVKIGRARRWHLVVGILVGVFMLGLGIAILVATFEVSTSMKRALGFVLVVGAAVQLLSAYQMTTDLKTAEKGSK